MAADAGSTTERDGDLSRDDRLSIEDHLDACGDCRRRRSALVRSMSLLSAAATESPIEPHAPSLWQGVAARIEAAEASQPSIWSRVSRALLPASTRTVADRAIGRLDRIRGGLPLQLAWMRDSIGHDLPDLLRTALDRDARSSVRLGDRIFGSLTSPAGLGAVAAATVFVVAASLVHRSATEAEARIAAESRPIPIELQAVPLVIAPARAEAASAGESRSQDSESSPSTEPEALAQVSTPSSPASGSAPTSNASKSAAVRRYDHDLEYGIPMPPDARIAKPAY